MYKSISPQDKVYFIEKWIAGTPLADIASYLGITFRAALKRRETYGLPVRCVRRTNDQKEADIRRKESKTIEAITKRNKNTEYVKLAWIRGDTLENIAKNLGYTVDYISRIRTKLNLPVRRVQKIPENYLARIRRMRESGMHIKDIAKIEGKSTGTIHEQLIRAGCGYTRGMDKESNNRRKITARSTLSEFRYRAITENSTDTRTFTSDA